MLFLNKCEWSQLELELELVRYALSWNIIQHSNRNFVSPRGHVFNSIECSFTINLIKSQFLGSEWDYVIISLVRSMNKEDIEREPSLSWLRERLGFVTDDHQMNVGITRARRGLCIIGKSRFRRRTFHEPNLMHWIRYMRSMASESIRSTCFWLSFLI